MGEGEERGGEGRREETERVREEREVTEKVRERVEGSSSIVAADFFLAAISWSQPYVLKFQTKRYFFRPEVRNDIFLINLS